MVPGTLLPLLDVTWAWKIARSLFPGTRIDKVSPATPPAHSGR